MSYENIEASEPLSDLIKELADALQRQAVIIDKMSIALDATLRLALDVNGRHGGAGWYFSNENVTPLEDYLLSSNYYDPDVMLEDVNNLVDGLPDQIPIMTTKQLFNEWMRAALDTTPPEWGSESPTSQKKDSLLV